MANRGRPLPFSLREQIKARRATETVRQVAKVLGISKSTVIKYASKFGTKL